MTNTKTQLLSISNNLEVKQHVFLNMLARGLIDKVENSVPELILSQSGKSVKGKDISVSLNGQALFINEEDRNKAIASIKTLMQRLKPVSALIDTLKE